MANTNVTLLGARKSPLTDVERILGFNVKYTIPYSDVNTGTGASDTVTVTLGATPAKWLVTKALANVTTAYAGTTAFTLSVGTTTNVTAFMTAVSVMTAGVIQPANGPSSVATPANATGTATINLAAVFTNATGGSPSALSAGSVDILLSVIDTSAAAMP